VIHAGDTIENPVTGERILFRKTSLLGYRPAYESAAGSPALANAA
jgi:hypothetical protein